MYDKDGSGSIDLAEMIEIIGTLYEMEGVSKVRKKAIIANNREYNYFLLNLSFGQKREHQ